MALSCALRIRWRVLLAVAWLACVLAQPAAAALLNLNEGRIAHSDAAAFPAEASSSPVTLPDRWERDKEPPLKAAWYRLAFIAPEPDAQGSLYALHIERACSNAEVHVNGVLVYRTGSMTEPFTRDCYHPRYVSVPASLLHPGSNLVDIKVVGYSLPFVASTQRAGGLSPVVFGSAAEVTALHLRERFRHETLPQIVTGILVLLGVLSLSLAIPSRSDRRLVYFGLLCLAWAFVSSRVWLTHSTWPNRTLEMLIAGSVAPAVACAALYLLRDARWRHRIVDSALLVQCFVVPASLLLARPERLFVVASAWYALLALEVIAAMVWYLWLMWRKRRAEVPLMAALLAAAAVLMAAELALQQNWLQGPIEHLTPFAIPLVLALLGARSSWQLAHALQRSEGSHETLESRIRDATAEMERSFKMMAEMRVEQVTQQERKRIAADLHDDLGAKLLTIVHTSTDERIATLAREALEEMRLSVRGLTGKPVRLADALGDWRAEVVNRLSEAGVESEWRVPQTEFPEVLPARSYVQTTRILREAVSNVIKHSGASRCSVRFKVFDGDFQFVIQDNGRGIPMELDGRLDRGHGMSSMKHRAKQMRGQCLVESGPGFGTVIRLTLPLEHQVASA